MDNLLQRVQAHHSWAVDMRRYFHAHPEISGRETGTQEKILAELRALGIACRKEAGTGVVAELAGALPGRTVAIRADIDALPLQDECGAAYQSKNPGACHACGHDGHMAVLLGVIRVLRDLRENLAGKFRLIFQPEEEEFPSGALKMVQCGALDGVDAIIGAHIWQPLPLGVIGISYGNLMAAPDKFTIRIQGRGGHGSMPHQTVDPTLVAAEIILALNTIVSRNLDPLTLAVLSVGSVHTGDAFNVIPETAVVEGTVRSFEQDVRETIFRRIREIAAGIAAAHGASCTVDALFGHPAVINDPAQAEVIKQAADESQSVVTARLIPPVMCGEDFSHYLEQIPGAFFFIGTGTNRAVYPHHHPKFDLDERCILHGMEVMTRAALKLAAAR